MKSTSLNVIVPLNIFIALVGLIFWAGLGIQSGIFMIILTLVGLMFFLIASAYKFLGKAKFWYEIPIDRTNERGVLMYAFGLLIIFSIAGLSVLTQTSFYNPLVAAPLTTYYSTSSHLGSVPFSAIKAATSDFGTWFLVQFVASRMEEIILGMFFVIFGSLVAYGIRQLIKIDFGTIGNTVWDFTGAMIVSVGLFAMLHVFNGTYLNADGTLNISLFVFAGVFRLINNILVFAFGNFGILFSTGVHEGNNMISLLNDSPNIVINALFYSGFVGYLFVIYYILILFFSITSLKKLFVEGRLIAKDFMTIG